MSSLAVFDKRSPWPIHPIGALLAVLAGLRHAALMTSATNDNFLHMTLAQQLLAGDWPVRDFFDGGWVLQYILSAAAEAIFGQRLLGEVVIVGVAWALSTYFVFRVVRTTGGSTFAATCAGLLLILAAARGYSYPKAIVYATAAVLWWQYAQSPGVARAAGFGAWAAIAFYWRPDHGIYVAIAIALATWAAHGIGKTWVMRTAVAAGAMLALVAPLMIYVHLVFGLPEHIQTGLAAARTEHTTQGPHAWPVLRFAGRLYDFEPPEPYAPTATLRWSSASTPAERSALLARYQLAIVESEGEVVRVRLPESALDSLRSLINEPIVEDTAGIDRSSATLESSSWAPSQQRAFSNRWLRFRLLPELEGPALAIEVLVAVFYVLPIAVALAAGLMATRSGRRLDARAFVAFAVFAFLVDLAMLRIPFPARVFDALPLSAILFGCCVAWLWQGLSGRWSVAISRACAVVIAAALTVGVARAGQFTDVIRMYAAGSEDGAENRRALVEELTASPPLAYYVDRPARFTLQLAAYVRECVPSSDRVLVLWFEPEIYYYSGRLMAQRHLVFAPTWAPLAHEQDPAVQKVTRYAPPIVLARESALTEYARATYPGIVEYVEREYTLATTVENNDERYLIFTRRDRPPVREFGEQMWPCFVRESSPWARVGHVRP